MDWIPDLTHDIIQMGFHHKGFAFIRVLQRCPEYMNHRYEAWVRDPARMLILKHENGLRPSGEIDQVYRNQREHDPSDRNAAREIIASGDPIPVGVLYRNPDIPCYGDPSEAQPAPSAEGVVACLEAEFDKFTIDPPRAVQDAPGAGA